MHPALAGALVERFADPSAREEARVLDPFMGSGTVLIESMVRGRRAIGVDLNPLAVRVARVKCMRPDDAFVARVLERATAISEASMERVRERQDVRARLPKDMAAHYAPHVLKELAGLREEIARVDDTMTRDTLLAVFSSMVVKFSNRRSDTSEETLEKRIGRFAPSRFFVDKTRELTRLWAALRGATPAHAPHPVVQEGDARRLPEIVWGKVACIVTSPPYGGTYDYLAHHAERICWLGLDAAAFREGEIGARRDFSSTAHNVSHARARFDAQFGDMLKGMRAVLSDDGRAVLLLGDGEIAGTRLAADEQMERLAPACGFEIEGLASSTRPDWRGGAQRREHAIALRAR